MEITRPLINLLPEAEAEGYDRLPNNLEKVLQYYNTAMEGITLWRNAQTHLCSE
jgi:hypothetical protein